MDHKKFSLTLLMFTSLLIGTFGLIQSTTSATTATTTSNNYNDYKIGSPAQVSVQTTSGLLYGAKQSLANVKNSSIYKFLSVPYAEPPVDQLRFMKPTEIRPERAQNFLDTTRYGKTCPQFRHLTRFISPLLNIDNDHQISEDCLHLNIFVPSSIGSLDRSSNNLLEPSKQLPVIVWIPGEGFDFADARQYDGSYLAHKTQSIVITVQYRVGIFGFLRSPKQGISGNMGLYDQVMALKWIKKNVDAFGGDSNRISVMGRFSGSMSISTLITAPVRDLVRSDDGRALFNRAIMLSGVAVNDWIIESQQSKQVADIEQEALSKKLCTEEQIRNGICLRSLSAEQLLSVAGYGWRLVVDNELIGSASPVDAIRENRLDPELEAVVLGETGQEGTLCLYRHLLMSSANNYAQLIEDDRLTTDEVSNIIQDDSYAYFKYNSSELNPIQTALKSFTDESNNFDKSGQQGGLREKYLDACSDYMVKSHSKRFRRNMLARNDLEVNRMDAIKKPIQVFHYELRYKPTFSLAPDYIKTAAHGDDVPLIFGLIYSQPEKSINDADLMMTRRMMSYIGNFVHGNNPLLNQHQNIETVAKKNNDSEQVISLDEHDSGSTSQESEQAQLMTPTKSSWSSESEVYPIEFSEADYNEISHQMTRAVVRSRTSNDEEQTNPSQKTVQQQKDVKLNIQLVVIVSPATLNKSPSSASSSSSFDGTLSGKWTEEPPINQVRQNSRSKYLLELSAKHQHQQQRQEIQAIGEFGNGWFIDNNNLNSDKNQLTSLRASPAMTKSQSLQSSSTQQMMTAQQPGTSFINESSFVTILLFSACIVIFALISFCIVLSLIVFRCNVSGANKVPAMRHNRQFGSSSCNICEDSQGDSFIEEASRKRANRSFCNVFTRLRHHNHQDNSNNNNSTTTTTTAAAVASPLKQLEPTQTSQNNRGVNGGLNEGVNHHHHK